MAMTLSVQRINATGEHIVRGLHYLETRKPVDSKSLVLVRSVASWDPPTPLLLAAARMYRKCLDKRQREVGRAFSYGVGIRDGKSVWFLLLYGCHLWIATIGDRPGGLAGNSQAAGGDATLDRLMP